MNLRQQAAADLLGILEDTAAGFGWPIVVRNPAGTEHAMTGFSADISQTIDPQTGVAVAGRVASVALPIARLLAADLGVPRNVAPNDRKPWVVAFDDIHGRPHRFKVQSARPDLSAGIVVCTLELYREQA